MSTVKPYVSDKTILERIQSRLKKANTRANDRVFVMRVIPFEISELPAINIFLGEQKLTRQDNYGSYERIREVYIQLAVKGLDDSEDSGTNYDDKLKLYQEVSDFKDELYSEFYSEMEMLRSGKNVYDEPNDPLVMSFQLISEKPDISNAGEDIVYSQVIKFNAQTKEKPRDNTKP